MTGVLLVGFDNMKIPSAEVRKSSGVPSGDFFKVKL